MYRKRYTYNTIHIQKMPFSVEHLMIRPTPMEEMKDGISISFASDASPPKKEEDVVPKVDRDAFLLGVSLPVEPLAKLPSKMPPKKKVEEEKEKKHEGEEKGEQKEKEKEKTHDVAAYQKTKDDDTYRGRLVFYEQGRWMCPHIVLTEAADDGKDDEEKKKTTICVFSKVPDAVWLKELRLASQKDPFKLHWEFEAGQWKSSTDRPSNYRQLAMEDQDAIQQSIEEELRSKFKRIDWSQEWESPLPPLIVIDDVEDFCDEIVVNKNANAVKLYNELMESTNTKIVAVSSSPCYRDPAALALLFNLLRGFQGIAAAAAVPTKKTRHRKKRGERKTRMKREPSSEKEQRLMLFPKNMLPKDVVEFGKEVSPMVTYFASKSGDVEYTIERCEMSPHQFQQYVKCRNEEEDTQHKMEKGDDDDDVHFLSERCCNYAVDKRPLEIGRMQADSVQKGQFACARDGAPSKSVQKGQFAAPSLQEGAPRKSVQKTLYEREVGRLVDECVKNKDLEKFSPKYARVLKRIQESEKNMTHIVYTRYDLEGEIFKKIVQNGVDRKDGHLEQNDVDRRDGAVHVVMNDLAIPASADAETTVVHILEPPDESMVQIKRVLRGASYPTKVFIYVSTISQKLLMSSAATTAQNKWKIKSANKSWSKNSMMNELYLGETPEIITSDEFLLERALLREQEYEPFVDQMKK